MSASHSRLLEFEQLQGELDLVSLLGEQHLNTLLYRHYTILLVSIQSLFLYQFLCVLCTDFSFIKIFNDVKVRAMSDTSSHLANSKAGKWPRLVYCIEPEDCKRRLWDPTGELQNAQALCIVLDGFWNKEICLIQHALWKRWKRHFLLRLVRQVDYTTLGFERLISSGANRNKATPMAPRLRLARISFVLASEATMYHYN